MPDKPNGNQLNAPRFWNRFISAWQRNGGLPTPPARHKTPAVIANFDEPTPRQARRIRCKATKAYADGRQKQVARRPLTNWARHCAKVKRNAKA